MAVFGLIILIVHVNDVNVMGRMGRQRAGELVEAKQFGPFGNR
mgnify:CR=1 FL=1